MQSKIDPEMALKLAFMEGRKQALEQAIRSIEMESREESLEVLRSLLRATQSRIDKQGT